MPETSFSKHKNTFIYILAALMLSLGVYFGASYLYNNTLHTVMKAPDFELTDQNSQKITNKDLLGKVYVVEFFFAQCPTICPVMKGNLKFVEKEISSKDFALVSVSIDPQHDTPSFLKQYAEERGITNPNWHLLTGDRSSIGQLADEFEIYVGKQEDKAESLNHSGMVALVDQEGNVRCRYGKDGVPILFYSVLNYEDEEGKNQNLQGKYHPDRQMLLEDIKKLLQQ